MNILPQVLTSAEPTPPRRLHSVEKKRRIVEESLLPNASVARVARSHGVNANQVFFWRKLYRQGLLGTAKPNVELLAVQISDAARKEIRPVRTTSVEEPAPGPSITAAPVSGTIYLELPKAQLRIEGAADPSCLRAVLDCLLA